MRKLKAWLRWLATPVIRCCGSRIHDAESGVELGRAWIVVWGGQVHLIGFTGGVPLVPVFLPEDRVRYWRRRIGFRVVPVPDYPRTRKSPPC